MNSRCNRIALASHELGHVFGLGHNRAFKANPKSVMGPGDEEFNEHEMRWMDKHHYFNNVHAINGWPKVVRTHNTRALLVDRRHWLEFRFEISSVNLLHSIQLVKHPGWEVVGESALKGRHDTAHIKIRRAWLGGINKVSLYILDAQGNFEITSRRFKMPDKLPLTDQVVSQRPVLKDEPADSSPDLRVSQRNKLTTTWAALKK